MSWNPPGLVFAGTIAPSSWGNLVREALLELRATPQYSCDAYHSTTQVVTAGPDAVALDSEYSDLSGMHSTSVDNSRITIPTAGGGWYQAIGSVYRSVGTGGGRLSMRVNGTALRTFHSSTEAETVLGHLRVLLVPTDYIDMAYEAITNTTTTGSATAALANRLIVYGPLPPS